ncbi:MAG: hypothetical protein IKV53_03230 [Clostridia bacterium]|nr:hypothetical protein [Clostridia bacterium]
MENIKIPEKYREDFERALNVAVKLGSFSDTALAEALNISKLNAAILIGFMDKYEFLFPSSKNEVKAVRLNEEQWEAIGCDISRYVPQPIEEKQVFRLTPVPAITGLGKKTVEVKSEGVMICHKGTSMFIPAEEVTLPHYKKATLFSRGFIYFGEERPKNARLASHALTSLIFNRRLESEVETLMSSLISDLERKL